MKFPETARRLSEAMNDILIKFLIFSTFLQNYAKCYKVTHLRDFWHFLNQNKKSNYSAVLPLVALFLPRKIYSVRLVSVV